MARASETSQARNVSAPLTVPLKFRLGVNRTCVVASARRSRADPGDTAPSASQFVPSRLYCHVPEALSAAMTAMPLAGPSASATCPAMRAETSVGVGVASSLKEASALAPLSTGAALEVAVRDQSTLP